MCVCVQINKVIFLCFCMFACLSQKDCVVSNNMTLDTQSCQVDSVFSPLCPSKQLCVIAGFASLFYNSRYGCQDM